MKRMVAVCAFLALTGIGIGSALAQPPMPYGPVPAPRNEVEPGPRSGYYWEPGHWHWNDNRYVWFGGHWVAGGPRAGHWVVGHWRWDGVRYIWVAAHWD